MTHYRITLEGETFDVRLLSDPRQDEVQVEVNGRALTVEVCRLAAECGGEAAALAAESAPARPAAAVGALPGGGSLPRAGQAQGNRPQPPGATGAGTVTAPLPGVVKSIRVQRGQTVQAGEDLLVIEAMKMDNAIHAPRAAVIEAVLVTAGQQVAHGEALVEYR